MTGHFLLGSRDLWSCLQYSEKPNKKSGENYHAVERGPGLST